MNELKITITKTANGKQAYIHIMSDDYTSVNVALIADKISIKDARESPRFGRPHPSVHGKEALSRVEPYINRPQEQPKMPERWVSSDSDSVSIRPPKK